MALTMSFSSLSRKCFGIQRSPITHRFVENKLCCHPSRIFHNSSSFQDNSLNSRNWHFFKASNRTLQKFKISDKVSKEYVLIYKAPMESLMKTGYPFLLLSLIGVPSTVLYNFYKNGKILFQREVNAIPFANPELELWLFSGAMCLCAWAVCLIIFKYPFRVYKHRERPEYVAMFLSAVPLRLQQFWFQKAAQATFKNPLYLMMENNHYILDGKRRAFLLCHYFRTPADLCDMLGID